MNIMNKSVSLLLCAILFITSIPFSAPVKTYADDESAGNEVSGAEAEYGSLSGLDESPSQEVSAMMGYMERAVQQGLNLESYIQQVAGQLAYFTLGDTISVGLLRVAEAACRLYQHPLLLQNYGAVLHKIGYLSSALTYYGAAWYASDIESVITAQSIGRVFYELAQFEEAEMWCDKALSLDESYGLAHQLKAMILLWHGNQEEAVEHTLKSALTVWNDISEAQFDSLVTLLEDYYDEDKAYLDNRGYDTIDYELVSPIDDYVDLLLEICSVGWDTKYKPTKKQYDYFIPEGNADAVLAVGGDYEKLLRELNAESVAIKDISDDLPIKYRRGYAEYGGNEDKLIDNRRQFYAANVLYCHYMIKHLQMTRNRGNYCDSLLEDAEQERISREDANHDNADAAMTALIESSNPDPNAVWRIYLTEAEANHEACKDYVTKCITHDKLDYGKYEQKFWEEFMYSMDLATYYITDKYLRDYFRTRVDKMLIERYKLNPASTYIEYWTKLSLTEIVVINAKAQMSASEEQEEERKQQETEARARKAKDQLTDTPGAGRANGVIQVRASFGGITFYLAADMSNRIHMGYDAFGEYKNKTINLYNGVSTTTTITKTKASFADNALFYGNEAAGIFAEGMGSAIRSGIGKSTDSMQGTFNKLGSMIPTYSSETGMGVQVTTDKYNNVLDTAKVRYKSTSASFHDVTVTQQRTEVLRGAASTVSRVNTLTTVGYSWSAYRGAAGVDVGVMDHN